MRRITTMVCFIFLLLLTAACGEQAKEVSGTVSETQPGTLDQQPIQQQEAPSDQPTLTNAVAPAKPATEEAAAAPSAQTDSAAKAPQAQRSFKDVTGLDIDHDWGPVDTDHNDHGSFGVLPDRKGSFTVDTDQLAAPLSGTYLYTETGVDLTLGLPDASAVEASFPGLELPAALPKVKMHKDCDEALGLLVSDLKFLRVNQEKSSVPKLDKFYSYYRIGQHIRIPNNFPTWIGVRARYLSEDSDLVPEIISIRSKTGGLPDGDHDHVMLTQTEVTLEGVWYTHYTGFRHIYGGKTSGQAIKITVTMPPFNTKLKRADGGLY